MSRQFDEYMSDKYEINGELYSLISPDSFTELMQALESRDLIQLQIDSSMHDEDDSGWQSLLQEQEELIREYLDSIGEFDNSYLINNIAFLAKRSDLRFGELEKMLGISAGYISRTAKENSPRRLSIDVVWKIARLFEVGVFELIETDLTVPKNNSELVLRFIEKLLHQTEEWSIDWHMGGGGIGGLDSQYIEMGLISEEGYELLYHPKNLSSDIRWQLAEDIFYCNDIDEDRSLVIVPFNRDENPKVYYDFVFVKATSCHNDLNSTSYDWEIAFSTADDPFIGVREKTDQLYEILSYREYETRLSPSTRRFITDYLKRGKR